MTDHYTVKVVLDSIAEAQNLFGDYDENLKIIEENFNVHLVARGSEINISGRNQEVDQVARLFKELVGLIRNGQDLNLQQTNYAIDLIKTGRTQELHDFYDETVIINSHGKPIRPKTIGQKQYVQAIKDHDIVLSIGPAGTGKTYLAIAMAVMALKRKEVSRIILTRPAVEAGEKLGFLPGDLQDKVDPYLRPLYDALYDTMGVETFQKYIERRIIEVAPLAYMRGRTLDDSFIILDEAQNTTHEQMKMFLTRLGFGSKAVVTGDITQIDLPRGKVSGLKKAEKILKNVKGIEIAYLTAKDVVRHQLVQRIIAAYDRYDQKNNE